MTIEAREIGERVICYANHGTKYEVAFYRDRQVAEMFTLYRRRSDSGIVRRCIYNERRMGEQMSITAACAGRSAVTLLEEATRSSRAEAAAPPRNSAEKDVTK